LSKNAVPEKSELGGWYATNSLSLLWFKNAGMKEESMHMV
jgi:hypothetical protein